MIQRIQSVWLLLAGLINILLFYFCFYSAHQVVNNVDTIQYVRINDHYVHMLMALVSVILPVAAIFMFKKRKQQRSMVVLSIIANLSFIATMIMLVSKLNNSTPVPTNGSYGVGAVLPVIAIIFLFLAIRGINKDEKLVKSVDRLR